MAREFADGGYVNNAQNVMLSMEVPVNRIVGTSRTGFGCLTEGEFVILGSVFGDNATIRKYGAS